MEKYLDRHQAGIILAKQLKKYAHKKDTIILALPRGGVPVAYEIAKALCLPLDVFIVRKLGVPGYKELAMGAIAQEGTIIYNQDIINSLSLSQSAIDQVITSEKKELALRIVKYRGDRPLPELGDKTILLVDDGIATGATMHAAIDALRRQIPHQIIVAVPVAASSSCDELSSIADAIICPAQPINFRAVGLWYEHFDQTSDFEVTELLKKAQENNKE